METNQRIVSKVHPYLGLCDSCQLNHVSILSSVVSRDAGPLPADRSCDLPSEPHCTLDHPVPLMKARPIHEDSVMLDVTLRQPISGSCIRTQDLHARVVVPSGIHPLWTLMDLSPWTSRWIYGPFFYSQTPWGHCRGLLSLHNGSDRCQPATGSIRHLFMPLSTYTCSTQTSLSGSLLPLLEMENKLTICLVLLRYRAKFPWTIENLDSNMDGCHGDPYFCFVEDVAPLASEYFLAPTNPGPD